MLVLDFVTCISKICRALQNLLTTNVNSFINPKSVVFKVVGLNQFMWLQSIVSIRRFSISLWRAQVKLSGKFMRKVPKAIRKESAILVTSMYTMNSLVCLHLWCNIVNRVNNFWQRDIYLITYRLCELLQIILWLQNISPTRTFKKNCS